MKNIFRKVTREIADYIFNLKSESGYREIIKLVEEKYGLRLSHTTIFRYYDPFDEVKENFKEIASRPEIKKYKRNYERKRYQNPDIKAEKRKWEKEYLSKPGIKERIRKWKAEHAKVIYHLPEYLTDLFSDGSDKSLNELSDDIFKLTKIRIYPTTLKKKISLFLKEEKIPPLDEIEEGVYRLKIQ